MVERRDLLDRDLLARWLVQSRAISSVSSLLLLRVHIVGSPDYTICTLSDHVLNIILIRDVEGDLS